MVTARLLPLTLAALVGAVVFARGADPPAAGQFKEENLAPARDAARQLVHDLEQLQDTVLAELKGDKVRKLYKQIDHALGEAVSFQQALKTGAAREEVYKSFDDMDHTLHDVIEGVRALGEDQRALRRSADYLQATDDQLHFLLSAGDTSEARTVQVVQRQARAMTEAAEELARTAKAVLADSPGQGVLVADMGKLAEATEKFQRGVPGKPDREELRKAFADVNHAWERVSQGLKNVPPQENVFLLRGAVRLDELLGRMHKLLGIQGERPGFSVRT